jgi:hypothetical protein
VAVVGLTMMIASLASAPARADGSAAGPLAWLAARPELQRFERVAVTAGDPGADSGRARDAAARVLAGARHHVATLLASPAAIADRESRADLCRGFDALAVVKNSTAGDRPALTLTLYNSHGDLVAELAGPGLPAAALTVDARRLSGPVFYEAVGRPDLAKSYRRRHAAKITLLSAGGSVLATGVFLAALEGVAAGSANTIGGVPCAFMNTSNGQTCARAEPSPLPWIVAGVGALAVVTGAAMPSDPLTETEREALLDGGVQISAAPAARGRGGTLVIGGRF